jgi:nitrite reductase (NADH) large subunit
MSKQRLVVIGNGMAGCRAIEEVLARDPDRYEITVFGAEPRVNYNRIMLSPVLSGEKTFEDIIINDRDWYADNGVVLHCGKAVLRIDREARLIEAEDGLEVPYDKLILAVGSDPVRLPLPGAELSGVITFRDLDDVEAMVAGPPPGGGGGGVGGGRGGGGGF